MFLNIPFCWTNESFFFLESLLYSRVKILSEEDKKTKEVALQDKLDRSNRRYLLRKRCGVEVDMEQARELVGQKLEIYFVSEARWRLGTVRKRVELWIQQVYTWRVLLELLELFWIQQFYIYMEDPFFYKFNG